MSRFTEKQLILATGVVSVLMLTGFVGLWWLDYQSIHKAEVTDADPSAAEISDPEEWGENRKIYEIRRQMDAAQAEADLIAKREQDVIVYREIVNRDSKILPDVDDVNNLARTIDDFANQSGVHLKQVVDLSISSGGEAIKTMPIKLQIAGTYDQFLKFVNLFESMDRIINTRAFSIAAGRVAGQGRDRRAVHEIQLELLTYIYTSSAGLTKPVDIANYDRRKDDPVIQKLVRQQKAARVDKYQLKQRINRRDPLVDPRRPGGDATAAGDPADVQKQRDTVEKLKFDMEVLKEDVRQEALYVQEHKYVALATLKPMIDKKCSDLESQINQATPTVNVAELLEVFHDDVVAPFEAIKSQRKLVSVPLVFTRKQASEFLDRMKANLESREYEKVVRTLADFDTLVRGLEQAEDAAEVVSEMRDVGKEAQVMIDFLALRVKTSGLIIRPGGSMVLINGKVRKAGDFVDASNRCRLKEIHDDHLLFELDGLEIEHSLDKK